MTGGIPDSWYVTDVTAAARRVVGQWPTAESLAVRLAAAFSEAADEERDPERKNRLRQIANFLGETGKDIAAEVMAKVILRSTGMGSIKGFLREERKRDRGKGSGCGAGRGNSR